MKPNLDDPAERAAYRLELSRIGTGIRRAGLAIALIGAVLVLLEKRGIFHVPMVVGFEHGEPWVIHDVQGVSLRGADGTLRRIPLNGVSVTPLLPLQFDAGHDYVDRMTAIVHPLAPLPAAAH